jgi:hypothetical protein
MASIVIHRYSPTCAGIGDFVLAASILRSFCIEHGISYYMDITNPIREFFDYKPYTGDSSEFEEITKYNHIYNKVIIDKYNVFLESIVHQPRRIIIQTNFILENANYISNINKLNEIFTPTLSVRHDFKQLLDSHSLTSKQYICIHIRFGDNALCENITLDNRIKESTRTVEERVEECLAIRANKDLPVVLIADHYESKVEMAKRYGFVYFDIRPTHTSFTTESDAIQSTVLEFLTFTEAAEVLAVSRSGFSYCGAAYGSVPFRYVQGAHTCHLGCVPSLCRITGVHSGT